MASVAQVGGLAGNVQGGQADGGTTANVAAVSGQNPQQLSPEAAYFSTGNVTEADKKMLVDTVTEYRSSWAQDRLERIRQWMQNLFYWKGIQVIRWDTSTNCWYDALAWARSQGQDSGEDTDLERWINPLVLMFCNVFTGTMSRAVPKTTVKPQNADPSLKDTVTAKSAVEAMRIIERKNKMRSLVRSIFELLFLFGTYFRYTRAVVDGDMFGYDEVAQFEDIEIAMPARYKCPNCGTETPAAGGTGGMTCPGCGSFMGQESYFGAGEGNRKSMRQAGIKKVPRAGVKWSLHSPLEIDMDPKAKGEFALKMTATFSKECEIDVGEARRMFPALYDKIQAGAESSTTPNASVEKLARLDSVSAMGGMTADNSLMNPTYGEHWLNPMAYDKKGDRAFAARMNQAFPEGLKLSMIGELVVDIRAANLQKEWSHASLYANQGIFCAALANTAVSFNARFNRVMWILDDWASRAALGLNFFDAARVDTEKMSGKPVPAGTGIPVPMRINGEPRPMTELMAHYEMPINPALWGYPQMLMTFLEVIIGIPRQMAGQGTQHDVETLGGQQLQLDRAATTLKPYWENVQDEHACASQNAFGCLQALMKTGAMTKLTDVIKTRGDAFQNVEVDWTSVQGNVEFSVDEDQDLPVSPDELRSAIQAIFEELSKNNPAAAEWFAVPANQDLALSTMVPGSVLPSEAQQLKTLSDIQTIIDQGPVVVLNQDGSKGTALPVHPSKMENFPIAKQVVSRYIVEHFELRTEDPMAWALIGQYYDELDEMDMTVAAGAAQRQMKVHQAAIPPKPGPDQGTQAAIAELHKVAVGMVDRLAEISALPPLGKNGSVSGQVSAAKENLDTAVKVADLMAGSK
jgi:ribosomal protein L37AE/L43A